MALKSGICLIALAILLPAQACFAEGENLYFMSREPNGTVALTTCDVNDCYRVAVAPKEQVEMACTSQKSAIVGKTTSDVAGALIAAYFAPMLVRKAGTEALKAYNAPIRRLIFKRFGTYLSKVKVTSAMTYAVGVPAAAAFDGGKFVAVKEAANHWPIVEEVESEVIKAVNPLPHYNIAKVVCGDNFDRPVTSNATPNEISKAISDVDPEQNRAFREAINHPAPGF